MGYELAVCSTDSDRRVLWPATLARKLSLTEVDGALTLVAAPAGLEKFRHSSYPIENHTTIRTETFGLKRFRKRRCENLSEKLSGTEIEDLCN